MATGLRKGRKKVLKKGYRFVKGGRVVKAKAKKTTKRRRRR